MAATAASCPTCGVAVVPGYVRCPKCHATLPRAQSAAANTALPGGTSVRSGAGISLPAAGGIGLAIVVVIIVMLRSCRTSSELEADEPATPTTPAVTTNGDFASGPRPELAGSTPLPPPAPSRQGVVSELDRALDRQRLWSTVESSGNTLEVRTAACNEARLQQTILEASVALRGVGLTRLRCLTQSGAVVFQRDL